MTWTTLRAVSSAAIFQPSAIILVVVPIVSKILIAFEVDLHGFTPWVTSLWLFWAGVAFGGVQGLYGGFGPAEIKKHDSSTEFIKAEADLLKNEAPGSKGQTILANLDATEMPERNDLVRLLATEKGRRSHKDTQQMDHLITTYYPTAVQKYLTRRWETANRSMPLARFGATALFGGGAFALAFLAARNLWAVLQVSL